MVQHIIRADILLILLIATQLAKYPQFLTVQESNKSVLHQVNSLTNSNHPRSQQIRPGKQILPKQNNPVAHLHHLYFIRLIHSLTNRSVGETMDNWTARNIILFNKRQSSVVAKNLHVAFLCLKGGQYKKSGRIFCVRQGYF